jgi:DNA replication protein DnaC
MAPLSEPERRDFWEICEDRYQVRSTILTSQLPVSRRHEQIGDPRLADGILDRLVHNAHPRQVRCGRRLENRLPLTRRSIRSMGDEKVNIAADESR